MRTKYPRVYCRIESNGFHFELKMLARAASVWGFWKLSSEPRLPHVPRLMSRPRPPINIFGLAEDPQGRICVATTRVRVDSSEIDIFDPAGKFLGTRRIVGKVMRLYFNGGDLFALTQYTDGDREEMKGILRFHIR